MPVPGPAALGRGVVVQAGDAVPAPWASAAIVVVDEETLRSPGPAVTALHLAWAARTPVVVVLGVDAASFRVPAEVDEEPWRLGARFEVWLDRLHFLVWANTYDARGGIEPVWWWARKAARLGAGEVTGVTDGVGDVVLADGTRAWVDGGPRGPLDAAALGAAIVHSETVDLGLLRPMPAPVGPMAGELAPDQLAAVAHGAGPARIVAPAGSGKTRVLTERLRHLHVDRGVERETTLAVAYNKKAQEELEQRTTAFRPRVSTLNALGYRLLADGSGRSPRVIDDRDARRIVEGLVPAQRRRANTDPIAPYFEGLGAIRLGLREPDEVEASRDDVPGLAAAFAPYRRALAAAGAVDFDEQVYGAIELLLRDGQARRRAQAGCRHLLVDELQDLTPAHVLLLRLLASPGLDVFGVGDDDQCHPPGTLVETTNGPLPIEALDPEHDRLISWDGYGTALRGFKNPRWGESCATPSGFEFRTGVRPFSGELIELRAGGRQTLVTPDHRVYARWCHDDWHNRNTTLLYLMRKGRWFRVGTCFLNRSTGAAFGLSFRARQEGADAAWVLAAYRTQAEALVAEKVVAANFGLPQTTFLSPARDEVNQAALNAIFEQIEDMDGKAQRLLAACGRELAYPFYDASRRGRMGGATTAQVMRACNVVSGVMETPIAEGRCVSWSVLTTERRPHDGLVHSIAVEPHHNYVADGIVVRNCIYGHAGADPSFLIDFEQLFPGAASHPLEVNYRCPVPVVEAARTLLSYNTRRVPKEIRPGPDAETTTASFEITRHASEAGASTVVEVISGWLAETGVEPADVAVLTRVNSLLLAPHVALVEAGVPVSSTLPRDVLDRTGVRAALAYLRLGATPDRMQPDDLAEVLRRPSRGFPQWIGKWFQRPLSIADMRAIPDRIDDAKVGAKVLSLADDLARVSSAVQHKSTRHALAVIADEVGLGSAMSLLDSSKGGQTASQLDDLEALQQVADLHRDPATFERWLRDVLARPTAGDGVTLSTVHRVKGMEWDRVVVSGVQQGILPHRLAEDDEEERRVLHVAITRGRRRVTVLADAARPSPFLDELTGVASHDRPKPAAAATKPAPSAARERGAPRVTELPPLPEDAAAAEAALRAWRTERSRADKVSPFIVASNLLLRAIAVRRPANLAELATISGIGPTKLDLYGDEIIAILDAL